jgi:glycosyltransferase involved in cell wall biosynthesis
MKTRVLFVIPSLAGGGAERFFCTLLKHLDRDRFELHLGLVTRGGVHEREVPDDVVVHHLDRRRVSAAAFDLVKLVRKVRPAVILSTLGHLNLTLLLVRPAFPAGTRLIVREAAIASSTIDAEVRFPELYKWVYRTLYPRADNVVCLSESMIDDFVEHFGLPRSKLVRIYNADEQRVRTAAAARESPFTTGGPNLVMAGRLHPQKGIDVLFDALPHVLSRVPSARVTLLGEGPAEAELRSRAERLGLSSRVEFVGFQANPYPYLKHADLFLLPSRYEGFPNVLLEVLALGTPAIAADCSGALAEIRAAVDSLVLVPPEDPMALADAIVTACTSSKRGSRVSTGAPMLGAFELSEIVQQYGALFERHSTRPADAVAMREPSA